MKLNKFQIGLCFMWILFALVFLYIVVTDINHADRAALMQTSSVFTMVENKNANSSQEIIPYRIYKQGETHPTIYTDENIDHILTEKFYQSLLFSIPVDTSYWWKTVGNTICLTDCFTGKTYRVNFDGSLVDISERSTYAGSK